MLFCFEHCSGAIHIPQIPYQAGATRPEARDCLPPYLQKHWVSTDRGPVIRTNTRVGGCSNGYLHRRVSLSNQFRGHRRGEQERKSPGRKAAPRNVYVSLSCYSALEEATTSPAVGRCWGRPGEPDVQNDTNQGPFRGSTATPMK